MYSKQPLSESKAMSSSDPSAATDGFSLKGIQGYRVIISADSGATLSGGGTAECWLYSESLGRWMKARSTLNLLANVASVRDLPSEDIEAPVGFGRVFYKDVSITKSAGSLTITFEACK
jgi:hypothetical protein